MKVLNLPLIPRRHVKLVRQQSSMECGLACVAMIANYYGANTDLPKLREISFGGIQGTSVRQIVAIASAIGLQVRPVKLPLESLKALQLPAILHWDMQHFVVLEEIKRDAFRVHDPSGSSRWCSYAEIDSSFTGVALEVRPSSDFVSTERKRRVRFSDLWSSAIGIKRSFAQVLLLSVVLEMIVITTPLYLQLTLDRVVPNQDLDLLTLLALAFAGITILNAAATALRSFVILLAGSSIGYGISSNVGSHLMKLSLPWFETRSTGDILTRFQSVRPIRQFMTEGAVVGLIDGAFSIFLAAVMLFYSPMLALFVFMSTGLFVAIRVISYSAQRRAEEEVIVAMGREQAHLIESLRAITTIRLLNKEQERIESWQNRLVDVTNAQEAQGRISNWQFASSVTIFGLEIVLTVWIGATFILDGGFSIGMLIAFFAYRGQFIARMSALLENTVQFVMLRLHLERVSDIALSPKDKSFDVPPGEKLVLRGDVELQNVTFRYGTSPYPVLNNANLRVTRGEFVAITGSSGEGKSTLVKLILGLLQPESGMILVDGQPLESFGIKNFHDQIGVVLQDDALLAGNLYENISFFEDGFDRQRVEAAAKYAEIDSEIMRMPMRYYTMVGEMGAALSGGQRQRLLLARALYRQPKLLIMDEGTSHLDIKNESLINETLKQLGITRIVVAHRQETINAADRRVKIEAGSIIDCSLI